MDIIKDMRISRMYQLMELSFLTIYTLIVVALLLCDFLTKTGGCGCSFTSTSTAFSCFFPLISSTTSS
jgi:hypothetical protein